jgi:hypothetical protein
MALTKATFSMVEGAYFNVQDYGAVGDGVVDDTAAIRACIAASNAEILAGNTGIFGAYAPFVGTQPTVYFPTGVYKITDYLTADNADTVNYTNFCGENAIIVASAGVVVFGGVSFTSGFADLTFRGGATHISIKTNNTDNSVITITNCIFSGNTGAAIKTDNNCFSTLLIIDNCKFRNDNASSLVLDMPTCDLARVTNCWVENSSSVFFRVGSPTTFASLHLFGLLGVPLVGGTSQTWIENYGRVVATQCRFGGEFGGCTIVVNKAPLNTDVNGEPTGITIRDSSAYCASGTPYIHFTRIPNLVNISGIAGLTARGSIKINDDSLVQADLNAGVGGNLTVYNLENLAFENYYYVGQNASQLEIQNPTHLTTLASDIIDLADVLLQIPADSVSYGHSIATTGLTTADAAGLLGVTQRTYTSSGGVPDNLNYINDFYSTALTGICADQLAYTMSVVVYNNGSSTSRIELVANGIAKLFSVPQGKHILNFEFIFCNPRVDNLLCGFSIANAPATGVSVTRGPIRIFLGGQQISTCNTIAYNSVVAAPVAGNWNRGDKIVVAPTAASPEGYICTASGTPGTWRTFGTIS